ncbi:MAG: class II glutamine amidotransferase [Stappiaceae bacterium]
MCELFAMSCSRPAAVTYSLKEFARHGGGLYQNKSGWGIAYAHGRETTLIKEPEPANDSPWVNFIAGQELQSDCVIAHVRHATVGQPKLENTHPFRRALGRRVHVFAHNGTLKNLHDKQDLTSLTHEPIGETDSELAFCMLLERMMPVWKDGAAVADIHDRLEVFSVFAREMAQLGSANFLYSDGDALFVHAHKRIYEENGGYSEPRSPGLSIRNCLICDEKDEWKVDGCHVQMGDRKTMLLASVPLDQQGWDPIEEGAVLAVRGGEEIARIVR